MEIGHVVPTQAQRFPAFTLVGVGTSADAVLRPAPNIIATMAATMATLRLTGSPWEVCS